MAMLYRESVQPYLISLFRYTPVLEISKVTAPVLIIQGDRDLQVGTDQARALKLAKPDATLSVIPGMNHVLKTVDESREQNLAAYGNPSRPLASGLMEALIPFLDKNLK